MSSAWPVPTATTLTCTPLAWVKAGSKWANSPDCSVEVVEATTMDGWAWALKAVRAAMQPSARMARRAVVAQQMVVTDTTMPPRCI